MAFRICGHAALALAAFGLAACGDSAAPPADTEEGGVPGLSVENARLVLPPVSGNPAAVYFDVVYDGERGIALSRAEVEGAKEATFHEYGEWEGRIQMMDMLRLPLKQGDRVSFEPGGRHLMAFDLAPEIEPGDTAQVTLTVSGGDSVTFPAEVKAAGEER